ncbi:hypothetical protein T552_01923 [Pneumocystis carinii B80]|uniref:Uncharacterized protein n=1 Tax=Pneumocystis carinii (strain B80) TaxID=1408658 RepID=A0A0W4ZI60_PNEC8|nr:hypothetical protein T552_01923 [Pneumocystis carinii B80]KTW28061.1 hypothetical protein T552_01923 [Pneumocystis carinii B80]
MKIVLWKEPERSCNLQNKSNKKKWIKNIIWHKQKKDTCNINNISNDRIGINRYSFFGFSEKFLKKTLLRDKIIDSSFNHESADIIPFDNLKRRDIFLWSRKISPDFLSYLLTLKQKDFDLILSSLYYLNENIKKNPLFLSKEAYFNSMESIKTNQKSKLYILKQSFYTFNYHSKLWLTVYIPKTIRWFVYMWILFVITFALYEFDRILNIIEKGINTWYSDYGFLEKNPLDYD